MKKKAIALAIASAMVTPTAFAAQDTSGMQYTSAAEGFYASLRVRYNSGGTKNAGGDIQNASSRFGVRGSNDLGNGLSGFYQYEAGVNQTSDGGGNNDLTTRLLNVGLRSSSFGEIVAGQFWPNSFNWVYGSTDIANTHSGNFAYNDLLPGRIDDALQYTTPDLNGFQGALLVSSTDKGTAAAKDKNGLDYWSLSAKYSIQGFTVAGSYITNVDALTKTVTPLTGNATVTQHDHKGMVLRLAYEQDNWYVTSWYAKDNASDTKGTQTVAGATAGAPNVVTPTGYSSDTETISTAAGVALDRVNLYVVYETREIGVINSTKKHDISHGAVGVQYNLGSRSRVWVEYASQDSDANDQLEDYITIGLRHDF